MLQRCCRCFIGELDMYITQDGHGLSLRKVLEVEIRNKEQGEPTKKARVTPAGRKVEPRMGITETKPPRWRRRAARRGRRL